MFLKQQFTISFAIEKPVNRLILINIILSPNVSNNIDIVKTSKCFLNTYFNLNDLDLVYL